MTSNDPDRTPATLTADDAREYSESLGRITEGWWRLLAWSFRQGIPESLDMTRKEWAETYHGYLKLPIPERREAVAELTAEGLNNSEIADALGVAEPTVRRDKASDSSNDESTDSKPLDTEGQLASDSSNDETLTWAEQEEIREKADRQDAVRRIAEGLQAIVSHWFKLENLPRNELRKEVIATLSEHDRERLQEIAHKIGMKL